MTDCGIEAITVRWVGVNTDDDDDDELLNVRSRFVGREGKAKTRDDLLAHELFSAMPPLGDYYTFIRIASY